MARLLPPVAAFILTAALAAAQDSTAWRGGAGLWNDPSRWNAGLPVRDAVDLRVVRDGWEGSGRIIRWVREAGQPQ